MTQLSSALLPTDDTGDLTSGTSVDRAFFTTWRDAINTLLHSATNPTISPSAAIDELVTARNGQASLDAYLDTLVALINASSDVTDVGADFGENVSAGNSIYLSIGLGAKTVGKWYKTDSANTYSSSAATRVGFAPSAVLAGESGYTRQVGIITGLAGLTAGSLYYASNTPGGLTATKPANAVPLGVALSTTALFIIPVGYLQDPYPKTLTHTAGLGTGSGPAPARIGSSSTTAGTTAVTTEEVLHTYTLPADSLDEAGDECEFTVWGDTAANANNKTLKVYFGATSLTLAAALPLNAIPWRIVFTIKRTGATTQIANAVFLGSANIGAANASPAETLANAITVKITGQNGTASANDIRVLGSSLVVK